MADSPSLTDWHVEGEIRCPDCGRYFVFDDALDVVVKFTALHDCTKQEVTVPP